MTSTAAGQRLLLGTSWKMNKTLDESVAFVESLLASGVPTSVDVFILPAHTALAAVRDRLPRGSGVQLGAQNAHWASEGAYTGEISMRMVQDAGATMVEVGHSERRTHFAETDADVCRKVAAALEHDLVPLVCVGETALERDTGSVGPAVVAQVRAALAAAGGAGSASVVVAYEPTWAIGAQGRAATPEAVAPVVEAIRSAASEVLEGPPVRVLYGGSVDEANAGALLDGTGVDGLFVGRAGLSFSRFQSLIELCADRSADRVHTSIPTDREGHHAACR